VTNGYNHGVFVIDAATNEVTATVTLPEESFSYGIAVSPDGTKVYVTNMENDSVSVIDAATNAATATVTLPALSGPREVTVSPDGTKVYVTNEFSNNVLIIDTATNDVTATVTLPAGSYPWGVAVSPDGTKVYVMNSHSGSVSIIDTATNDVTTVTLPAGSGPVSFGQFIAPATTPLPTPAPYDGFIYINFVGTSEGTNLPIGKLYISTDSTNPESPGYEEIDIRGASLVVPVKHGVYCFMISSIQPKNYVLHYQPLVPQDTG
jgi:YVTN family beta-propeller protein